jgi:hypothetical protein
MNQRTVVPLGIAAAILIAFFGWEWYLSPRARVVRFLDRAAEAAEEKDTARLLSCFSSEYSDFRNMDYASLSETLQQGFDRVDRLNVTLDGVRAEVGDEEAEASFDLKVVAIHGHERYLLVGGPIEPQKMRVQLRREEGEWKILHVGQEARELRQD